MDIQLVEQHARLMAHNTALRDNLKAVLCIKEALAIEDYMGAHEYLSSFSEETMSALWISTSKGGIWTTRERELIRSVSTEAAQIIRGFGK